MVYVNLTLRETETETEISHSTR